MCRELGCEDRLQLLQCWVGVRSGNAREYSHDAAEEHAAPLHGDDGIVERRRFGIVGDCGDLCLLLRHAGFDRGLVVLVADGVEGRRLEGKRARRKEGIGWAKLGGWGWAAYESNFGDWGAHEYQHNLR